MLMTESHVLCDRGEEKLCSGTGRNRSALWEHPGTFQGFWLPLPAAHSKRVSESLCTLLSCQASSCVLKEALKLRGMVQHCGNHIKGIGKLWAFYHCLHILSFTRNKQHCSAFCGTHVSRWVSLMKYLPI